MKLTKKQLTLLDFIRAYTAENQISPSYREIMRAMNLSSVSAVAEHIENLVARGALKKIPGAARSLEIIEEAPPSETALLFATKIAELERSGHSTDVAALRHAAELLNVLI